MNVYQKHPDINDNIFISLDNYKHHFNKDKDSSNNLNKFGQDTPGSTKPSSQHNL
jgi:hypothetical protein